MNDRHDAVRWWEAYGLRQYRVALLRDDHEHRFTLLSPGPQQAAQSVLHMCEHAELAKMADEAETAQALVEEVNGLLQSGKWWKINYTGEI